MKPILFNTEMVQAILDGRKTVTRRVVKPQPHIIKVEGMGNVLQLANKGPIFPGQDNPNDIDVRWRFAPYKPGDIIYVRETWGIGGFNDDDMDMFVTYRADDSTARIQMPEAKYENYYSSITGSEPDWRPSIHMPREAARIFLKVTDVRVERLQDMPHDAPLKEGIRSYTKDGTLYKYAVSDDWWIDFHRKHKKEFDGTYWQDMPQNPTTAFSYLWNSTIKKQDLDQFEWEANPWVWVVEFEQCEKPTNNY